MNTHTRNTHTRNTHTGIDPRLCGAVARLDDLGARRGADARFESLAATFSAATRLEAGFWDMGMGAK